MVLMMTMEYLYCKATGQEMEEKKRWFQFWKDDVEVEKDTIDDSSVTSSTKDDSSYQSTAADDSNVRIVNLKLPSSEDKLGIAFHDNKKQTSNSNSILLPELAYIDSSSPIYDQIPTDLHKGWYVTSLESVSIGKVHPKDADECVECIARARKSNDTELKIRLIQIQDRQSGKYTSDTRD